VYVRPPQAPFKTGYTIVNTAYYPHFSVANSDILQLVGVTVSGIKAQSVATIGGGINVGTNCQFASQDVIFTNVYYASPVYGQLSLLVHVR